MTLKWPLCSKNTQFSSHWNTWAQLNVTNQITRLSLAAGLTHSFSSCIFLCHWVGLLGWKLCALTPKEQEPNQAGAGSRMGAAVCADTFLHHVWVLQQVWAEPMNSSGGLCPRFPLSIATFEGNGFNLYMHTNSASNINFKFCEFSTKLERFHWVSVMDCSSS